LNAVVGAKLRRVAGGETCLRRAGSRPLLLAGGNNGIEILELLLVLLEGQIAPARIGWNFL